MSMHLVGPYMTTTNYKKRKAKKKTKSQLEAEARHAKFLKRVGYTGNNNDYRSEMPNYKSDRNVAPTSNVIATHNSATAKKQPNVYTGTLIKGIATMHKSNAVPVTSREDAIAVSNMRRG